MAGSALNLSRLSRGIGEVKTNGHERVDVVLEPEDYYNLTQNCQYDTMSPLPPEHDVKSETDLSKHCHNIKQINLPKTFTTRKGALLLFSEDFAHKLNGGMHMTHAKGDAAGVESLKTVDEFTKSILAFGSNADGINLHFIHNVTGPRSRQFRPGYSARRYLSRLTRSIDFNILDSLVTKGHVSEKSLFQTNSLLPSLRRRINDDVSYPPAPYRIMKTMLMAPGLLSGFTFYKFRREKSDLTTVKEDDENQTVSGITARGQPILQLINEDASGGSTTVTYNKLSNERKGGVLADLLVKSAINHALEKHEQIVLNGTSDKQNKMADIGTSETSELHEQSGKKKTEVNLEFNMDEALQSYLGSQMEPAEHLSHNPPLTQSTNGSSVTHDDIKGYLQREPTHPQTDPSHLQTKPKHPQTELTHQKKPTHPLTEPTQPQMESTQPQMEPTHPQIEPTQPQMEPTHPQMEPTHLQTESTQQKMEPMHPQSTEIKDIDHRPNLPRSDTLISNVGSYERSSGELSPQLVNELADVGSIQLSFNKASVIPPIQTEALPSTERTPTIEVSHEATFNSWPVLPSIGSSDNKDSLEIQEDNGMTAIHIQPATPSIKEKLDQKEGLADSTSVIEDADIELHLPVQTFDGARLGDVEEISSPQQTNKPAPLMSQIVLPDCHDISHGLRGNVLHTKTSTRSQASSVSNKSKKKGGSSVKGSVIFAPDGKLVSIGGSIGRHETESAVSDLAQLEQLPEQTELKATASEISEEEEVWGQKVKQLPSHTEATTYMKNKEMHADQSELSTDAEPLNEQQLLENLTEHAHTIAKSILSQPGTGLNLTQDAQTAAQIWRQPMGIASTQSLQDLGTQEDIAIQEFIAARESGTKSASPSVDEYKKLLRDTLAAVVSQVSGESADALAQDAQVSAELLESLIQQQVAPADIEIAQDEMGQRVIRVKSASDQRADHKEVIAGMLGGIKEGHIYQEPKTKGEAHIGPVPSRSIQSERVTEADVGEPGMIHYGEKESPESVSAVPQDSSPDARSTASEMKTSTEKSAGVKSDGAKSSRVAKSSKMDATKKDDEAKRDGVVIKSDAKSSEGHSQKMSASGTDKGTNRPKKGTPSDKTSKGKTSGKQQQKLDKMEKGKSVLSKDESKEEFVVGKVKDPKELENLYGAIDLPPASKESSRVDSKKKPQKEATTAKKKTLVKKGGKSKKTKSGETKTATMTPTTDDATKNGVTPPMKTADNALQGAAPSATKVIITDDGKSAAKQEEDDLLGDKTSSETVSDDMEFTIIRDEFPDSDQETKPTRKSVKKSAKSSGVVSMSNNDTPVDTADDSDDANQLWTHEARAAKRAAQAKQRRQLVAQRRKEREEQIRREKEEAERREKMERELEEDQRRRTEQRRLEREQQEQEELAAERAEKAREHQARMAAEREKRQREEYQRKMEEMRQKQAEEDRLRKEMEERRKREAEEAARLEAIRVSRMLDEEREEYERRRQIEEEERFHAEQMEKLRREAEAQATLEAARKLAEELAQQQAALELRLRFNRQLHLEGDGLSHTQTVSRAFVFSYYQLLKWLGLELPSFEHYKESHPKY